MTSDSAEKERVPGTATTQEIAGIIEQLAPILDQYPMDQKLISLAATMLIVLDPNIDLTTLRSGTDIVIHRASEFVAKSGSAQWLDLPPSQVN
jgi:hypothetical protein